MWREYQPNPLHHRVGDCAVRAVSAALDIDWDTAFCLIAVTAFAEKDMPSSDAIWGAVLRQHGFYRATIPNTCPDCYTAEDFCKDHPEEGTFVLAFGGHTACVKNGELLDAWDSSQWIPQYYYYRKDE